MSGMCLEYNLTYPRGPHGGGLAGWTVLDVVGAPAASFMSALCPGAGLSPSPGTRGRTPVPVVMLHGVYRPLFSSFL